ncbi:lytic transglycosylase domain-containing protein (plasmid) [Ralstonia syzygii subsp. celebesensis]|uniref:Lytic transglycosylase n=2 Tax=Ralstonia syzygii subsp. celebesensis TaxID=1310168 RepID=A0A1U9VLV3_9RALS|nr:lytic transglycosylase domain-containing protein [Ralstonia syzygii]AQW31678.1 lytic transglycosylase [blood disease bacterium A2-HR MARDI]
MPARNPARAAARRWSMLAVALLACLPPNSKADCVDDAAAYHDVNPQVLRAIGYQESHLNPQARNRNRNGSEDLGMFQINSIHLPELSRYGIERQMLFNPCVSAYVAAWHLSRKIRQHGNNWWAVGAYHSESPEHNGVYARAVEGILNRKLPLPRSTRASMRPAPADGNAVLVPSSATAQPMRAITARRAPPSASATPTAKLTGADTREDDRWLDSMLISLNRSASLRERFAR